MLIDAGMPGRTRTRPCLGWTTSTRRPARRVRDRDGGGGPPRPHPPALRPRRHRGRLPRRHPSCSSSPKWTTGPARGPSGSPDERWLLDEVALDRLRAEPDRLLLLDGDAEVVPGLSVHLVGGHTAGMQVVRVETGHGTVVLASDAAHFYENLDDDRPAPLPHSMTGVYAAFDRIRELARGHRGARARSRRAGAVPAVRAGVRRADREGRVRSACGQVVHQHVTEHPAVVVAVPRSSMSRSKIALNVCRFAVRNTQNALIAMCTSSASTSSRNAPAARPRSRMRVEHVEGRVGQVDRIGDRAMCSARWMFSMLTSRMKSGCDSWWSKVSSASWRIAVDRVEVLDVELLLQRRGSRCRRARAPRRTAVPCRRSSSRSSASWCGSGRRSRRPGRRRSPSRRTRARRRRGSRRGCARRRAGARRRRSPRSVGRHHGPPPRRCGAAAPTLRGLARHADEQGT